MKTNMASHSGGMESLCSNEEMASEPKELNEFMKTATLPLCVCVVRGKHLTSSVQLTTGDILFLKSCETKTVTLTHQDSSSGSRKQVNVPLDFPYKFKVLPPKNVSDRTASIIMYPSVSDLMLDSPTYFEATSNYDDPYLPGFSIHRGDKFKFRGLVTDPKDGRERLKVTDELENVLLLSLDCRANFFPLEDEDAYTLRQLIDFAPVPRRLKISKSNSSNDSAASFKSNSGDSGFRDCFLAAEDEKDNAFLYDKDTLQMINFTGVIHMLKPNLLINASPVNDADTVWKIPLTADLCVREHSLDDYEVPSVLRNKEPTFISAPLISQTPLTPTFPAPPTPPMPQPLVPVDVFNFTDIYGCPVKAKIMDISNCDISLQTFLHGTEEISLYRLIKTKRLYAEDLKTNKVYSLSRDLNVSFIEYPEKFYTVLELMSLPVGSEITVLEDIASDFPRPILLQFGDLLRITTNTASTVKVKSSNLECKVLKCEKVNRDGGSNLKMKLPLDFEVNMVLSVDPNSKRVIVMDDLLSGGERFPDQEVATLIDTSEKMLQDLPVNLKLLKFMPERILVSSPFVKNPMPSSDSKSEITTDGDWPSPTRDSSHKNVGISLTSGLVLAFRERLDVHDINVIKSHSDAVQVPYEILTKDQYEERERLCKVWVDEEESDVQSTASDDRSSTIDSSSQASEPTRQPGKRPKSKKIDKIRRLSQVLNPKHWRPPKAPPEPLPHPGAMGLMALSMRPPSDQVNVYEIKDNDDDPENLKQLSLAPHSSISSDEENNVYEVMEIGPLRPSPGTPPLEKKESKGFTNRFHKSMPLKQIVSRTYARNRAKRKEKSQSKQSVSSPIRERNDTNLSVEDGVFENEEGDEDPFYDAPELLSNENQDMPKKPETDSPKLSRLRQSDSLERSTSSGSEGPKNNTLPPLPPRRTTSSPGQKSSTTTVSKSMDNLIDQMKSSAFSEKLVSVSAKECQNDKGKAIEPPIPPRRKRIAKSFNNDGDTSSNNDNVNSNSSQKPECKSEQNLRRFNSSEIEQHSVSSLNCVSVSQVSSNSEEAGGNDDKVPYSTVNLQNKTTQPQRIPIPKPRGLKKMKSPEIPPKLFGGAKSDSVDGEVKRVDSTVKVEGIQNGDGTSNSNTNGVNCSARKTEVAASKEEVSVCRKESVKPKPPPKPKPRIG